MFIEMFLLYLKWTDVFWSNHPFICISNKGNYCCQTHQLVMILSLYFLKHIALSQLYCLFYAFNYCTLNYSCKIFFFEIFFLSWLTGVVTFNIVVIMMSFVYNIFISGVFRIKCCFKWCSMYSYLTDILRFLWKR